MLAPTDITNKASWPKAIFRVIGVMALLYAVGVAYFSLSTGRMPALAPYTCQSVATASQINSIYEDSILGKLGLRVLDVLDIKDSGSTNEGLKCTARTMTTHGEMTFEVTTRTVNDKLYVQVRPTTLFGQSPSNEIVACSPSDIKIKQADLIVGPYGYRVVGELVNDCTEAIGVELHITLRDSVTGKVVTSTTDWPAKTNNIPPHSAYAFESYIFAEEAQHELSMEIAAEAHRW